MQELITAYNKLKLVKRTLSSVSNFGKEESKKRMALVSHGRIYIVNGRTHQASLPGDPANNLSGKLSKSIESKVLNHKKAIVTAGNGTKEMNYAKYLETGTRNADGSIRMHARNNLSTVLRENEKTLNKKFTKLAKQLFKTT